MKWALVDKNNIVRNIIVYDEGTPYFPPDWLTVEQINDWIDIGDMKDNPESLPDSL